MLIIRDAQLAALARARREAFVSRLHDFLRDWKPGIDRQEVERGIDAAAAFGFERECDVASFVEIVCLDMDGFRQPLPREALAYLSARGMDPEVKLERLARWVASR